MPSAIAHEILLVDNGSTDDSAAVLARFAAVCGRVRVLHAPTPGLTRARNCALQAARGDIIAFIDDDCYVSPGFVDDVWSAFADRPDCDFVGGRVLLYDPADAPVTIATSTATESYPPGSVIPSGAIHGANMAFRRSALERIGGFDEQLGPGTPFNCEDADALTRVSLSGGSGAYDPRVTVHHHHRRRPGAELDGLQVSYAAGRGAFAAKYLLRRKSRAGVLRQLYWLWGRSSNWHERERVHRMHETRGAIHYLAARLRAKVSHS